MNLILGNPAGLWALLAVPAVLAIHFLQERARRVRTSTLFLLDHAAPRSVSGARFDRLRQSVPLWLQLLAAVLIAWLLAEPRWLKPDATQTIAVVLDSSASLSAFRDDTTPALAERLRGLAGAAAVTRWVLTESDTRQPTRYAGTDLRALLASLDTWRPALGEHDPGPALRLASTASRERGLVVFVTDRPAEVTGDVAVFSVAQAADNCGFAGLGTTVTNGQLLWRALICNRGRTPRTLDWWLETGTTRTPPRSLTLGPGETTAVQGPFPPGTNQCTLALTPDRFTLDDRLPFVRPVPKPVSVAVRDAGLAQDALARLVRSLPDVMLAPFSGDADVVVSRFDPAQPFAPGRTGILLPVPSTNAASARPGWIVPADHPLMRDLNWMGLLFEGPAGLVAQPEDVPLLWSGTQPLIVLRPTADAKTRHLIVNFDVMRSNALRLPAFLLLVRRFVEEQRAAKLAPAAANFDARQPLVPTVNEAGGPVTLAAEGEPAATVPPSQAALLRAPDRPGFFTVTQDGVRLLEGAAQFADAREADLTGAAPADGVEGRRVELVRMNSESDSLFPLWVLALLAAAGGAWACASARRPAPSPRTTPTPG